MKRGGRRFEIACYKNKVLSWRDGLEQDIDEVVQTHTVFRNVSKGIVAPIAEIESAFGSSDVEEVLLQILKRGELQVSEKERHARSDALFRDVANVVASLCVDPGTNRPITLGVVERAMKDAHVSVRSGYSAKQQALEAIKVLQDAGVPLSRAQMRLRIVVSTSVGKRIKGDNLDKFIVQMEEEIPDVENIVFICRIDPGSYRALEELVRKESKGHGLIEVMDARVKVEGNLSLGGGDSSTSSSTVQPQSRPVSSTQGEDGAISEKEKEKTKGKGAGKRRRRRGKKGKGKEIEEEETITVTAPVSEIEVEEPEVEAEAEADVEEDDEEDNAAVVNRFALLDMDDM